eukprot:tig00001056_g6625.t1
MVERSDSSTPRPGKPDGGGAWRARWSEWRTRWHRDYAITFSPQVEVQFQTYFAELHFARGKFCSVLLFFLVSAGAIFCTFGLPHQMASIYATETNSGKADWHDHTSGRTPEAREFAYIAAWTSAIAVFIFGFHLFVYFTNVVRKDWQMWEMICLLIFEGWCYAFFCYVYVLPSTYVLLYSLTGYLSNIWFRIRWEQSALVHGCGLAILPIGFSWNGHLRHHGEWGVALVVGFMVYFLIVATAWEFQRAARIEFRRIQRMEAETRAFLAANEELTAQLESKIAEPVDMSSPLDNALKSLNSLLQRALADRRVEDASDIAAALRHLMSTANLNAPTQLAEQGDEGDGSPSNAANQYIPSETVAFLKVMTMDPLRRRDARGEQAGEAHPAQPPPRSGRESAELKRSASMRSPALGGRLELGGGERGELGELWAAADGWLEFDIFRLDELTQGRPLATLGFALFRKHNLLEAFGIRPAALAAFLDLAEAGYVETPYHCRVHAADVLQGVNYLLTGGGLGALMRPLDVFAALVAAIVHDLEHPGRNNGFEIATSSERALLYNDRSVLENYSASRTFALLREEELDILAGLSRAQRAEFRKSVISMLLATDLAAHFDTLGTFKSKLVAHAAVAAAAAGAAAGGGGSGGHGSSPNTSQKHVHAAGGTGPAAPAATPPPSRGRPPSGPVPVRRASLAPADATSAHSSVRRLSSHSGERIAAAAAAAAAGETPDTLSPEERQLFLNMAIKVADIANAARPPRLHAAWVERVMAEFFEQGDEEKRLGLPLSPYCDRDTTVISKCQAGFIDFLASPLFTAWAQRFPKCQLLVQLTDANRKHWLAVAEQAAAPAPAPAATPGAGVSLKVPPSPKSLGSGLGGTNGAGGGGGAAPASAPTGAWWRALASRASPAAARGGQLGARGPGRGGGERGGRRGRRSRGISGVIRTAGAGAGGAGGGNSGAPPRGHPAALHPERPAAAGHPARRAAGPPASHSSLASEARPPGVIDSPRRAKRASSGSPAPLGREAGSSGEAPPGASTPGAGPARPAGLGRTGHSPRAPTSLVVIDPSNFQVDIDKLVMRPVPAPSSPDPPSAALADTGGNVHLV